MLCRLALAHTPITKSGSRMLVALATPASAEGGQLVDASGENGGGGLAFVLMVVMVVIIAASLFFMDRVARNRLQEEDDAEQ